MPVDHPNRSKEWELSSLIGVAVFSHYITTMPSKIRVGCVVSGATGELYEDDQGASTTSGGAADVDGGQKVKRRRRRRKRRRGTVIESVSYNKWMILWDDNKDRSIHASNILKFEAEGDGIRRGTMPPASSVAGVGAFASTHAVPVSLSGNSSTTPGPAPQALPPPLVTTPTVAVGAARPLPSSVATTTLEGAIPNVAPTEGDASNSESPTTVTPPETDYFPPADDDDDDDVPFLLPNDDDDEGMVDGEMFDNLDPHDPNNENVDDRYSQEKLFFEYDNDMALEMEKGREMMSRMVNAENEKKALMGTVVPVGKGRNIINWLVRDDVTKEEVPDKKEYEKVGVRGFDFKGLNEPSVEQSSSSGDSSIPNTRGSSTRKRYKQQRRRSKKRNKNGSKKKKKMKLFPLLQHLWPGDWRKQLGKMNAAIVANNQQMIKANRRKEDGKRTKVIQEVSENEFWLFQGILISASLFRRGGQHLWPTHAEQMKILSKHTDFSIYMKADRFKTIKRFAPQMFHDESRKDSDPWWPIIQLIEDYNANMRRTVAASRKKLFDEWISAFRPQSRKNGNLPHLSFIKRKPEPLGTEFKNAACSETGIFIHLELQRGKDPMKKLEFFSAHKSCCACSLRLSKESLHCGQGICGTDDVPIGEEDSLSPAHELFYADAWFASVEVATHTKLKFDSDFVGPVKMGHSRFPKKWLEEKMKDWPGGTWLVLEGKGDEEVDLIAIGYKYNTRKVLSFICTKGAGNTEPGDPYEARWMDSKGNHASRNIPRPDVISKYFNESNGIDTHNHVRQSELKLEKKWVTHDGYFRIFTSILGVTVIDTWKAYKHHLHARSADKDCKVLDFVEELAIEMLTNDYSTLSPSDTSFNISPLHRPSTGASSPQRRTSPRRLITGETGHCSISSLGMSGAGGRPETADQIKDRIKKEHVLEKRNGITNDGGSLRVKRSRCKMCSKKSTWICKCCDNLCLCKGDCAQAHVSKFTTKALKKAGYIT
eukprot:scaffold139680_cov35-Attheya_sp.AAC.1